MPPPLGAQENDLDSAKRMWGNQWFYQGSTTMYVIDHSDESHDAIQRFAIHFRKQHMTLTDIKVFAMAELSSTQQQNKEGSNDNNASRKRKLQDNATSQQPKAKSHAPYGLTEVPNVTHMHVDPMQKILRASIPPSVFDNDKSDPATTNNMRQPFFDADKHSNRSGAGFALSLRAATVASTEGECKVGFWSSQVPSVTKKTKKNLPVMPFSSDNTLNERSARDLIQSAWKRELQHAQDANLWVREGQPPSAVQTLGTPNKGSRSNIERRLHRRTIARRHQSAN
jgi:hypothetical protein